MIIHRYKPELKTYFTELNRAWVEKYFKLELIDIEQLYHPEKYVLAKGGEIFFLERLWANFVQSSDCGSQKPKTGKIDLVFE